MTVIYSLEVATASVKCFYRIVFRWKGSIWQAIWMELIVWLLLYGILSCMYRVLLNPEQRETFEDLCIFFNTYHEYIPITFMLGFYVSAVYTRWLKMFDNVGWIDASSLMISQYIEGHSEKARMMRRNVLRYMVLMQAVIYRDVSMRVKKRFPTMQHLVAAGLMTDDELKEFDAVESDHRKYWLPIHWSFTLMKNARHEGFIASDIIYTDLMGRLRDFRKCLINIILYDWVGVPLLYSQVAHLSVYLYFIVALFGRQILTPERDVVKHASIDIYLPIMSMIQFTFIMGWLKVAEVLLNPLGEDDDDFECNWIIDRNLQVGLSIVDDVYDKAPKLQKDAFYEEKLPEPLYTVETASSPCNPQVGSCTNMPTSGKNIQMHPRRKTIQENMALQRDSICEEGTSEFDGSERPLARSILRNSKRKLSETFRNIQKFVRRRTSDGSNDSRSRRNTEDEERTTGGAVSPLPQMVRRTSGYTESRSQTPTKVILPSMEPRMSAEYVNPSLPVIIEDVERREDALFREWSDASDWPNLPTTIRSRSTQTSI